MNLEETGQSIREFGLEVAFLVSCNVYLGAWDRMCTDTSFTHRVFILVLGTVTSIYVVKLDTGVRATVVSVICQWCQGWKFRVAGKT